MYKPQAPSGGHRTVTTDLDIAPVSSQLLFYEARSVGPEGEIAVPLISPISASF